MFTFHSLIRRSLCVSAFLVTAMTAASAQDGAPTKDAAAGTDEVGVIETDHGVMVVEFFPQDAPKHVEQFKKLANEGFFNDLAFHRIVKGFMIQGGDPRTKKGGGGKEAPRVDAEFNPRKHVRGSLSAARTSDPNSATSQFFLVLDPAPHLDNKYTNYGQMIAGVDVLLKIGDLPTKLNPQMPGEKSVPVDRVNINKVTIQPRAEALKYAEEKNKAAGGAAVETKN